MLGSNYPYGQSPLPLPAGLDAGGCNPTSLYAGNSETDIPRQLFTQDDPAQITADVNSAVAAGLSGFAVNCYGTGRPTFIWVGSYKYALSVVDGISRSFRPALYFVGGYQ